MTDRKPLLTELDALECIDDVLTVVQGEEPNRNAVITGALVIGIYQIDGYTKTMASRVAIGDMDHWKQLGIHLENLDRLRAAKPER